MMLASKFMLLCFLQCLLDHVCFNVCLIMFASMFVCVCGHVWLLVCRVRFWFAIRLLCISNAKAALYGDEKLTAGVVKYKRG